MDPELSRQKAYCAMINGMPLKQNEPSKPQIKGPVTQTEPPKPTKKKTKSKKKRAASTPVKKKPAPVTEAHNEPIGNSTKTQ